MKNEFLPPKQQRSRDTHARLLAATLHTLEAHGLEGATIPRIAEFAGVAPATLYRRFRDRDALYRAALMHSLEASAVATRKTIRLESFNDRTLDGVAGSLVATTIAQYRSHPGLTRALTRFIESDSDREFRARALALLGENFDQLVQVLLEFRSEVMHPDPRRAITFALLNMATVVEVRTLEQVSMWNDLLPLSDADLHSEITRSLLAYLRYPRAADDGNLTGNT